MKEKFYHFLATNKKNLLAALVWFLLPILIFLLIIKGDTSDSNRLKYQFDKMMEFTGPFESSNSNSRFALTEAIVEQGSIFLTEEQAMFSAPDIVEINGKFLSIFTPGISFIAIPFYLVGKLLSAPQLFTYLLNTVIALINAYLIFSISKKLFNKYWPSLLSGVIFLFATNSLAYSQTLTQHHGSTMIILLLIINTLQNKRTAVNNFIFGLLFGIGLLFDFPNLFLMFPILLFLLLDHLKIKTLRNKYQFKINSTLIILLLGFIPALLVLGWYNFLTLDSPLQLAQFVGRSDYFDPLEMRMRNQEMFSIVDPYAPKIPFSTRAQLQGLYVLLISNERSWLHYSPVLLLICAGGLLALHKDFEKQKYYHLIFSIIVFNIVIYSMFHDPWGGWSFGARYLIPAAALVAIFIPPTLVLIKKKLIFLAVFLILAFYSIYISTAGVLTTNKIPPKQESDRLEENIPYTWSYNLQLLRENRTSSLTYNALFNRYFNVITYFYLVTGINFGYFLLILLLSLRETSHD